MCCYVVLPFFCLNNVYFDQVSYSRVQRIELLLAITMTMCLRLDFSDQRPLLLHSQTEAENAALPAQPADLQEKHEL